MRVVVLLNGGAGGLAGASPGLKRRLRAAFAARGVRATVRALPPGRLAQAARGLAHDPAVDAVVAAGGDGTVGVVAGALAGTGKPLGVLPLGTLNHFARDLGLPQELEAAVDVVAQGRPRDIDVGEVNGRAFVNNSSIGIYPHALRERDVRRGRLGKWLAMLWALLLVFVRLPRARLRLETEGEQLSARTPFVFVGNNRYRMRVLGARRRQALDRGELSLYVVPRGGRLSALRLAFAALLGRLERARGIRELHVRELRVQSRRRRLHVATDGEVRALTPPLRYRIRPRALRVLAPVGP